MKVLLCGYMGSGKTTVGSLLAQKLSLPFYDLDRCIEIEEGNSVSSIFEMKGEIYFRKLEQKVFVDLMQLESAFVLSLGGGTPCYANNHLLFKGDEVLSVYLKASIDEILKRITANRNNRPLLPTGNVVELRAFIAPHLFERSFFYQQAKITITTDDKSPTQIVDEINSIYVK